MEHDLDLVRTSETPRGPSARVRLLSIRAPNREGQDVSKWPRHILPLPIISEPRSPVTGDTVNLGGPGMDLRRLGTTAPIYPELTQHRRNAGIKTPTWVELERDLEFSGPGGQLPRVGTQFEPDPYKDVLPGKIDPERSSGKAAGRTWWAGADPVPRCCVDGHGGTSTVGPGRNEGWIPAS